MPTPKVSIIIPVYNVERYIERCVRTLFAQTLDDLEYIFVDDCSPDNSIDVMLQVLEEYPVRKPQVKLIRHEINQGVSQSRQDGLDAATGEYIIHCDPDDWVELNMYEQLYTNAAQHDCDVVSCNFYLNYATKEIVVTENYPDKVSYLKVIISNNWATLWRNLIISRVAKKINFVNGINAGEDYIFICKSIFYSKNIICIDKPLYHYNRTNETSIIATSSIAKNNEQIKATKIVEDVVGYGYSKELNIRKQFIKDSMLQFGTRIWRETYPELPDYKLNNVSSIRKCIYYLLSKGPITIMDALIKIKLKK